MSDKATQCIHCGYPLNIQKDSAYDIIYNGFENNSLKYKYQANLIGCIRQLLKLDLTTAKRIIDNPPYILFHSVSKEQADNLCEKLQIAGLPAAIVGEVTEQKKSEIFVIDYKKK